MSKRTVYRTSSSAYGLGSVAGVIFSIALNHSFGWAVLHFFCGWYYVFYVLACRSTEIVPAFTQLLGL